MRKFRIGNRVFGVTLFGIVCIHRVQANLRGGCFVNQGVYGFFRLFLPVAERKASMNHKEDVERDNVIYHGTQQKMGFHLVFFWVLWSILVLQTLRQFASMMNVYLGRGDTHVYLRGAVRIYRCIDAKRRSL